MDPVTSLIDYDALHAQALEFKPKLIVAGFSAYPRDIDYRKFKEICEDVGCYLHTDMSHMSGMIAAGLANDPFEVADVVSTTSDKNLRGPKAAMIFSKTHISDAVDFSVFPMHQGGPHNHTIAALATQLLHANSPEFKEYIQNVKDNAQVLAKHLMDKGYKLITDGTSNHLILMSCADKGITGSKIEKACDLAGITLNKNTIIGDKSAMTPGGVRMGTPAVTTRGYQEQDMAEVARYLHEIFQLSLDLQAKSGKKMVNFQEELKQSPQLAQIRQEVNNFAV